MTPSQRDRAFAGLEAAKRGGVPIGRVASLLGKLARHDFDDARALGEEALFVNDEVR